MCKPPMSWTAKARHHSELERSTHLTITGTTCCVVHRTLPWYAKKGGSLIQGLGV